MASLVERCSPHSSRSISIIDRLLETDLVFLSGESQESCTRYPPLANTVCVQLVYGFLSARDVCRFHFMTSRNISATFDNVKVLRYMLCHERTKQIAELQRTGDIPLLMPKLMAVVAGNDPKLSPPSLERLHLLENPPRFEVAYFDFGVDTLAAKERQKLHDVADLLIVHRKMVLRIEGRAQPDAPTWIKPILSQRRAESARSAILAKFKSGSGMFVQTEIAEDVARRIKAVGMGSAPLINANFQDAEFHRARTIELLSGARTDAEYMEYAQLWRRCDLTVLGLEGEDEIDSDGDEWQADR